MNAFDGDHHARGAVNVVAVGLCAGPILERWGADETVSRRCGGLVFLRAKRYADDVGGVRLEDDGLAAALDD